MEKEVSILEGKDASEDVRKSSYQAVNSYFQQHGNIMDVDKAVVSRLVTLASEEIITSKNSDIVNEALQAIICCLNLDAMVLKLSIDDCNLVVKRLCICIHQTTEKTCCHRVLFALVSQKLADTFIRDKCNEILCAVEFAFEKWHGQSLTVENESINVIRRLLQQAPQWMDEECVRWGRVIVTMVGHKVIKLRENALAITVASLETLQKRQKDLHACLKPALKQTIIPDLKALMNDSQQVYALKTWGILVQMFGKELHSSSNLNMVLPVVEMGLRCVGTIEPRMAALQAWQQLIDNFSLNPNFLQDPKMVKLVMQALRFNNAKNECLALEKVKVWWHYIWLLDNKLSANFDLVCVPLLQFCVYGGSSGQKALSATPKMLPNPSSPATPHLTLLSPAGASQNFTFRTTQLLGCEALAHFLGVPCSGWKDLHYQLDCLRQEVVTGPTFFIKQSTLFITTATDLFSSLGSTIPEWLVLHIWERLVGHMRSAIDSSVKLDIRDALSTLLLRFQVVVLSRHFSLDVVLKMFKELCSLPKKVLGSTAYSVGTGEMVNGTPALFLLSLLLTPNLLESSQEAEVYHSVFSALVSSRSGHSTTTLEFLQSVLELLSSNFECLENKETAWRLWSTVVQVLMENITQTNEVNQGDALESNFSCCVQSLTFPAKLNLSVMPATSVKAMLKTWSDLYSTVNRLAALVPSAGANCVCEEVACSLLDIAKRENSLSDSNQVDMLVQMCQSMVSGFDFPSLGNQSTFNISASPVKRTPKKKQQSALENIHSVVRLLALLQTQVLKLVSETEHSKKASGSGLQNSLNVLVDTFCLLFSHVTSSNVIFNLIGQLAQPIGELLSDASKKTSVKVFNNSFQQKLETLWQDLTTAIQSRYTGLIDDELLQKVSPLLEATFLHSRRQIKNFTMSLWTSTFAKASSSLHYPESLRPVLIKVKAKTSVKLPGFLGAETVVVEETPVSQLTQTQAPEPHLPGMPSPHKIQHGSFLNKPMSPRPSRSPAKSPGSPGLGMLPTSVKKKLRPLDGFDDGDFVVIKYSPKKKMVLTEHQKEMLKEKRAIPAMYNSLEHSVDASLMSAHFTTDTQMDGTLSETPTPSDSQPFSVFGSVIPPSQPTPGTSDEIEEKGSKTRARSRKRTDEPKEKVEEGNKKAEEVSKNRRSGRNKSQEQTSGELAEKPTKENIRGRKKKNDMKESYDESIVLIEESEVMEIETDENIKETPGILSEKDTKKLDEIDLTKDSQVNEDQSLETQPPESFVEDKQEISDLKDNQSEKSSGQSSAASSVPQNVLGIITYTQLSSSKSSKEQSLENSMVSPQSKTDSKSDNNARNENSGNLSDDEPLSSWSKRLSQLSQSPKVLSPWGKIVSQESAVSTQKRSGSPLKSPKRNKKKLNDENVGKGILDKWVIRSPGKGVDFGKAIDVIPNLAEIIVANVSQTLVEETQSPSKFSKLKDKKSDKASPSIMETPPKNILENISVNFGHSNRKLFGSQNTNQDLDIVEDSNMVPGSPDAKTYKLNSPVLKLKKLTNEDIQLFTPSLRKLKQGNAESNDRTNDRNTSKDKTSEEIDDFSSFKPLDENTLRSEIIDLEKVEHQGNDGTQITFPGSEAIFSEDIDASYKKDAEISEKSSKENKKIVTETDEHKNEDANEMETDGAEESELVTQESSQVESQGESEGMISQPTPSGKSRKRKQITPKKMSPEDRKSKRKSVCSQNSESAGSGRKIGARVKSKKINGDENNEEVNSQDKRCDKDNIDGKDNSSFENSSGDKKAVESKRKNLSSEENKDEEKGSQEKKSNTDATDEGKNLKLEKVFHDKQNIDKKKRKMSVEVSKEEETGSMEKKLDTSEKEQNGKSNNSKYKEKSKAKQDKANEKPEKDSYIKQEEKKTKEVDKDKAGIQDRGEKSGNEKVGKGVRAKKKNDEKESEEKKQDNHTNRTRSMRKAKGKDIENSSQKKGKKADIENKQEQTEQESKENDVDKRSQKKGKKADIGNKVQTEPESKGKTDKKVETSLRKARKNLKMFSEHTASEEPDLSAKKSDENEGNECSEQSKESGLQDEAKDLNKEIAVMKESAKDSLNSEEVLAEIMDVDEISESTSSRVEPVGEQTPDSKTVQLPERRSTSKHKKEVTQKLLKKRIIEDHIDLETATKSDDELPAVVKEKPNIDQEKPGEKESVKSVVRNFVGESISDNETISDIEIDSMDETPKKATKSLVLGGSKLVAYSDSKLILGSRKFQKKGGLARRSILKTSSLSGEGDPNQIEGPNFHPIVVSQIYSPTASPSASILKRKRFVEDPVAETNSPPSKQRRVSFATPLIDVDNSLLPSSGSEPASIPVLSEQNTDIYKTKQVGTQDDSGTQLSSKTSDSQQTQSSMGSPSQSHYESTQESQLNTSEPVYPDLVHCDQCVDKILPQLTTTFWHRGLGQLVRARNIRTIGDLASMSETDIHSLPIRTPKVDTVRDVLSKFAKTQKSSKAKLWNSPKASKTELGTKGLSEPTMKETKEVEGTEEVEGIEDVKGTEAVESTQIDTTVEEAPVEAPSSSSDQLKADSSVASESVSQLEPIEKVHRLIEDLKKLKEGERKLVQEFFMMMHDGASKK